MDERSAAGSDKVDTENTKLWRIFKTVLEMLADRVCVAPWELIVRTDP